MIAHEPHVHLCLSAVHELHEFDCHRRGNRQLFSVVIVVYDGDLIRRLLQDHPGVKRPKFEMDEA